MTLVAHVKYPKQTTPRDSAYLDWVREQPCAYTGSWPTEVSHHPARGHGSKGIKCSDYRTLPLSPAVHHQWHQCGQIGNMSPEQSRAWVETQIVEHLSRYVMELKGAA